MIPVSPTRRVSARRAFRIGIAAYRYGIALSEMERTIATQTSVTIPNTTGAAPFNQFSNFTKLSTPAAHEVVAPNNDTLYSWAFLALRKQPIVLHVPAIAGGRYYTMQMLDPYSNVFAYVGTRLSGDGAGNYAIVGPNWSGRIPKGVNGCIESSGNHVWLLGRTEVSGAADLPAVYAIQSQYSLTPLDKFGTHYVPPTSPAKPNPTPPPPPVNGVAYFDRLGDEMAQDPPPQRDARILKELAKVGIGPGLHPSETQRRALRAALNAAYRVGAARITLENLPLVVASQKAHNGFFVPPNNIAVFGTDYSLRAFTALKGLGANAVDEAMYPNILSLSSSKAWVVHFAPGTFPPPVGAFWSLTMYDSAGFLVANPIDRYVLGSLHGPLVMNADGSVDIYLQDTSPGPDKFANWLPTPTPQESSTFRINFRFYIPGKALVDDTWPYPSVISTKPSG